MVTKISKGPARQAPARFRIAIAAGLLVPPQLLMAQVQQVPRPPQPQPVATRPLPDGIVLSKLLWGTMAAVDQANRTANYSVLRDLGSAGFQASNSAASLAAVFAAIRNQQVDVSDTLIVAPVYEFPPAMIAPDLLRMRGSFPLRPTVISFDLIFQWDRGWRLHGVAILPTAAIQRP